MCAAAGRRYAEAMQCRAERAEQPCFPYGTYAVRLRHHALVEPAPLEGEALVTAPGPLLADVQAAAC